MGNLGEVAPMGQWIGEQALKTAGSGMGWVWDRRPRFVPLASAPAALEYACVCRTLGEGCPMRDSPEDTDAWNVSE